jgi:hypothetical protein
LARNVRSSSSLFKVLAPYDVADLRKYLEAVEGHQLGEGLAGHLVVLDLQQPLEGGYRDSLCPPRKLISEYFNWFQ